MNFSVTCGCGKKLLAKPAMAGKTVRCPACQEPLLIRAPQAPVTSESAAVAHPVPTKSQPAEIVLGCHCGQQFKVGGQFAGQQVNCPACQTLCVIPTPGQAPGALQASPIAQLPDNQMLQQPGPFDPAPIQQPQYQQPQYQQPQYQQPQYQQPQYQQPNRNRAKPKTAIGIFIFAIAACVFGGGYALQSAADVIASLRSVSQIAEAKAAIAKSKARLESIRNGTGTFNNDSRPFSNAASRAKTSRTISDLLNGMKTFGAIALMLGITAVVVAAVFSMLSPQPLMALGIAEICVSAIAMSLLLIFNVLPSLGHRSAFGYFDSQAHTIINLLIAWTSVATFLIYSIFMMKAARTNPRAGSSIAKGSFSAMVSFSICAGIHLLLTITLLIGLSGEWALYFLMLIRFAIHAAMITGLVLLIKSCFSAKVIYRL
jgi:hypothetical protein